jgi:hypothetical protein
MTTSRIRLNRRQVLAASGAAAATALLAPKAMAQTTTSGQLPVRGVVFDTGTDIGFEGYLSRISWHADDVRRDLAAIREQLHCTAVQIVGTEFDRLRFAGEIGAEHGLEIWLQPRLFEVDAGQQLDHLAEGARIAQHLATAGASVVLGVGCETTLFQKGLVPGERFTDRLQPLFAARGEEAARIQSDLNAYLGEAIDTARAAFEGPVTYSAGSWEDVDWRPFDRIGVNLYRDSSNRERYREVLRSYLDHEKPTVVTEFGCGTFEGARHSGAGSFMIVDYSTGVPRIPDGFVRSEEEQANELAELITLYAEEGIEGAFVYNFLAQFDFHRPDDPSQDIDMASHAIVKSMPGEPDAPIVWEPKLAFHEVAALYRDL